MFGLVGSLFAQGTGGGLGSISGLVQDAQNAAVAGAQVVVANESKGIRRTLETNGQGVFAAPALIPAEGYSVTVSKSGFAPYRSAPITLAVGQNLDLRIDLVVAGAQTTVEVTVEEAVVLETKSDVSQIVNSRQIMELPINGRRVDSFVLMTPAVVPDGAFGLLSFRGVAGHNAFLTDGNDTTNTYYNENAGRTRITSPISQEAVQEFQVISNNYAAEFGQAMGGVVNTITKSGSNDVHGTGYWFFRNKNLNARDRYASFVPTDNRHQLGASLGGSIIKDKLFYFANYEATRRDFPAIATVTSANLFTAQGLLDTANATNACPNPAATIQATAAQCQAAIQMLTTRNFGTVSRTVQQDLGFAKIDYHLNDRNSLSFSLSGLRWVSPHGIQATGIVFADGNAIGNNADSTVRDAYGRAQWTAIVSPHIVNEARFGWFKDRLFDPASPDFLYPGLGLASLTVNSTNNLGVANTYPRLNPSETRFQYADNLSWVLGPHTMKFGVDITTTEDYQDQLINRYGSYSYSTLNNFALDFTGNTAGLKSWNQYSQAFGNPIVDTNQNSYGFYGQDQYRITSKLTLNYGLRYDYTAIPQPTIVNPDYPQTGRIPTAKDNIAPRAGISYNLDPKTIVRAGYGMFFARTQTGLISTLFTSNNVYRQSITYNSGTAAQLAAGPVYPNNLASTGGVTPGTGDITFADKNFRNPYTHQGNLSIERKITSDLNVTVSYLWGRGVRLYGVRDLNVGPLGDPITYTILDPNGNAAGTYTTPTYRTRPDSRYRRLNQVENPGISYYDGMSVQVNRRYRNGFQLLGSYTWSHAIDFNQSNGNNNIFFSSGPTSYENGKFADEKGSAANDVRHRAGVSIIWTPTLSHGNGFVARYLLNNWQLSEITTLQSAAPLNSTTSISGNAFNGALVTGSLNGCGCGFSRVPFQPVSNLDLDPIKKMDARLSKKLPFSERVTGYLTFEAFNVTNSQYNTGKRTAEYSLSATTMKYTSSYGTGSSTASPPGGTNARRDQVSMRLVF